MYGKDHALFVTAPEGWVLDNSSGVSQGLYAVLYPKGGNWDKSLTIMYVNSASKKIQDNESTENLISFDSLNFLNNFKDGEIKSLPDLKSEYGKEIKILSFTYSNYELVAYINEPKKIALIIMTSRDKSDFEENINVFYELVKSYRFMTSDVKFNK